MKLPNRHYGCLCRPDSIPPKPVCRSADADPRDSGAVCADCWHMVACHRSART